MLSQKLKTEVDRYYNDMRESNAMLLNAKHGRITPKNIDGYLTDVRYLIEHTPIYLNIAAKSARDRGLHALAEFYAKKIADEHAHDLWAADDLALLRERFKITPEQEQGNQPSLAIQRVTAAVPGLIAKHPALYLAYIFLVEYFTVLAGPEWLKDLNENCGIPDTMMSVIGKHAELDREHILDDMKELDELAGHVQDTGPFVAALRDFMELYRDFCSHIGRETTH